MTDSEGNENRILLMQVPASSHLHTNQADEAFMRMGDKSRKLNFDERMQLMYDKGERYYEDQATFGASIEDIDMAIVSDYTKIIGYGKSAMEYLLENNDFVTEHEGDQKVSNACILLFGKNPQRFFPRARTRFIRYEGTEEKVGTEMKVGETVGEMAIEINLTERQLIIYNGIKKNLSHTAKSLARQIGLSQRTIEREISFLRKNGFIDKSTKENKSDWVILK